MLVVRRSGHAKIPVYRVQHSGGADGVGGEETTKHTLPSSLIGCSAVYGKPLSVAYMRQIGNRLVIAHSTLFIHKSRSSQQACVNSKGQRGPTTLVLFLSICCLLQRCRAYSFLPCLAHLHSKGPGLWVIFQKVIRVIGHVVGSNMWAGKTTSPPLADTPPLPSSLSFPSPSRPLPFPEK